MDFFHCIPSSLSKAFEKLGRFVATHPVKIVSLSLISSILMGISIFKLGIEKDVSYLIAPLDCRAYDEQKVINQLFPMNLSTNFDFYRMNKIGIFTAVIVVPNDESSVLRTSVFKEAIEVDEMVRSFQIEWRGKMYNYSDVCAKYMGECYDNPTLKYIEKIEQQDKTSIKYPIEINLSNMQFNITGIGFGGVTLGSMRDITEAKALRLLYFLDDSDREKEDLAWKWESEFNRRVSKQKSNKVTFLQFSTSFFSKEFWNLGLLVLKYGVIVAVFLTTTCVLTTMTSDWITWKPLLAIGGCLSAGLAIIASFAMITAIGVPFTAFNVTVLFLTAGIGVDDMFILIAAWRKTDRNDSVVNRMGKAYSHAALSITMTSLTNLIAFIIGATIPIPMIRNFCIQSTFAIAFDFVYQLTFFGGCMALDGYREEKMLHPVTLKPIVPRKDAGDKTWIYRVFFTNKAENSGLNPPKMMVWFGDSLGQWISKGRSKLIILVIFATYVAGATWGVTTLEKGMDLKDFYSEGSEPYMYASNHYKYFSNFTEVVQVAINDKLDYSNRTVQKDIAKIIRRFHKNKYVSKLDFNWLRHYQLFTRFYYKDVRGYNLSDPREFNRCLRDVFFQSELGKMYKHDVTFDDDGVHITASRFILFIQGTASLSAQQKTPNELRLIVDSLPYSVTVHCIWWVLYELSAVIQQLTLQTILVTIVATTVVFLLLTGNLFSVICVTLSLVSITFGGIGYMALFGITLNFASSLALVVSIGLCVDNSAHVLCAFNMAKGKFTDRIEQTLSSVGMPIVQGTVTTILALTPVLLARNYMFRIMIILIMLEIIFSVFHAIFIVPIMLHIWEITKKLFRKSLSKVDVENKATPISISVIESSHL